jgi:glucose-1-phosphate cytidylyltransferase
MKVVILCGGLGSRLAEETKKIPKPMVKVGKLPILVHIIKIYQKFGFKDFILATGYKSKIIEKYFKKDKFVQCIFTGKETLTGGRLLRLKNLLQSDSESNFMLTYGDGISNQNIKKLLNFHLKNEKIATMTVVRPPVRFGEVILNKNMITSFKEKPNIKKGWINGGFFVLNKKVFDFIKNDNLMFERQPMELLCKKKQLIAYRHEGFWQCMDNIRDKQFLNELIKKNLAPWIA